MKISLDFYEYLRNQISLSEIVRSYVTLTRRGHEYSGLCPFHFEKSASFTVNDVKRFYHCFGCSAHGDVIKFVSELSGLSYKDAAIKLATDQGIEIPKITHAEEKLYEEYDQIQNIMELASEFFCSELTPEVIQYLGKRRINEDTIKKFNLGYAPSGKKLQDYFKKKLISQDLLVKAGLIGSKQENKYYDIFFDRIIFPIKNQFSKVIAFGGRTITDAQPKYLNSPETIVFKKNEALYAEEKAIAAAYKKKYMIICEGYIDVIAMHIAGFSETVACLGTAININHLNKIWKTCNEVIICTDGDEAGVRAAKRVLNLGLPVVSPKKLISFINLPQNSDPDDILKNNEPSVFQQLIDNRLSLSEMIWHTEFSKKKYLSAENKSELESNLKEYASLIQDKTLQHNYNRYFSEQLWNNIHQRKKNQKTPLVSALPIANNKFSDKQDLERALCQILIKFPSLLDNESIQNFLHKAKFDNEELLKMTIYLSDLDWEKLHSTPFDLKEIVEKAGFVNVFLLLSSSNNLFFNTQSKKDLDPYIIWQYIHKKYNLLLLTQEFMTNLQNNHDNIFDRSKIYQEEILRINEEIRQLNELMIS